MNEDAVPEFLDNLKKHDLKLLRKETTTLQISTGLLCNQVCKHCHLEAGPNRIEVMNLDTVKEVILLQERCSFKVVDITGGAPEMNPNLPYLIQKIAPLATTVMLRSNLTVLLDLLDTDFLDILTKNKVVIVSSLPSLNQMQTDSQRGDGIFDKSIKALMKLNENGYGQKNSDLVLNLVSNPAGAFMPSPQESTQKRYRDVLLKKWGITFNEFFNFANVPLGRFEKWLNKSGNYDDYLQTLYKGFNPCTVDGLMCQTLISVSWDGYLYDCDFNLAANLYKGYKKTHISQIKDSILENEEIAVNNHCYACTAGSGFT